MLQARGARAKEILSVGRTEILRLSVGRTGRESMRIQDLGDGVFRVHLPDGGRGVIFPPRQEIPPSPLQVFIVEDSSLVRDRLDAAVAAAGGIVVGHSEAANDAIAHLATAQPNLIIIDIQLRSGTGFDVLKALQTTRSGRSATKIVLTNHASAEYRDRSFQLGANAFFDKSSEASQVLELIDRLAA